MRKKSYICDDCGQRGEFTSYVKARKSGWAVAKDYSNCWCPNCAPRHRLGGAKKKPAMVLPKNCEQLKIDNL